MSYSALTSLHPAIRQCLTTDLGDTEEEIQEIVTSEGDSYVFVQSVVTLLTSISDYTSGITSSIDVSMSHESYIIIAGQHGNRPENI